MRKILTALTSITLLFSLPLAGEEKAAPVPKAVPVKKEKMSDREMQKEIEDLKEEVEDLKKRVSKAEKDIHVLGSLRINGFFDVYISNHENKPNILETGNFELHIQSLYKSFQVAAALVFNEGAQLGVAFIDYHLYGGDIAPRGRLFREKGMHIQVGKFDVPYGNDWQHFTSVNRMTVTPPLTTELIMEEGYNDVGVRLLTNFVSFYGTFYVLRGIDEGYSYGGNSFGGRIGITPFNNPYLLKREDIPLLDIAFSYIHDVNTAYETTEKLLAVDIEGKVGPVILRGEYYRRDKLVGILMNGFHVTTGFDFGTFTRAPLILFLRYDFYHMKRYIKSDETNQLSRLTMGFNLNIAKISYLKLEYQRFLTTYEEYTSTEYYNDNLFYLQLIISF